jgi:hydroxymethylbilane synthase
MRPVYTVGTRQSQLAMTQTGWVVGRIQAVYPAANIVTKRIVTKGDRILDTTLSKVGGKGLFVKEIEQALRDGIIDFAVHSMKDLPAETAPGLVVAAIPRRVDPRDALIAKDGTGFSRLQKGARVGTSSLRRCAQLKYARPDLEVVPLRGNIDTRLRKLGEQGLDAIVLAAAGLMRMGWESRITEFLDPSICVPAAGQGALAIQCRADDEEILELLRFLDDPDTRTAVTAERACLSILQGGCQVPVGVFAQVDSGRVTVTAMAGWPDGSRILRETVSGEDPVATGRQAGERLLKNGASRLLESLTGEMGAFEE